MIGKSGEQKNNVGIGRSGEEQPGIKRAGDRANRMLEIRKSKLENRREFRFSVFEFRLSTVHPIARSTDLPICYWCGNGIFIFWGSPWMCEVSLLRTFSSTMVISPLDIFTIP